MRLRVALTRGEIFPGSRIGDYRRALREVGLEPIDYHERARSLDGCAGLVLSGGADVDPNRYGAEPHPKTQRPNQERDAFELALLEEALNRDLPVLAICRGHQLLNVCFGGRLLQHIESGEHRSHAAMPHESRWHDVEVLPGNTLSGALETGRARVNSRHHQAVEMSTLATGLTALATSHDGLVEAVEGPGRWVVGVQWHPERLESSEPSFAPMSRRLFEAFAVAIGERRD
jgi:gamma-glutamyl-gamma-aminobutyrate hydrolase PuuD